MQRELMMRPACKCSSSWLSCISSSFVSLTQWKQRETKSPPACIVDGVDKSYIQRCLFLVWANLGRLSGGVSNKIATNVQWVGYHWGNWKDGAPTFSAYFNWNKVEDIQSCTAKFVMRELGLRGEPYCQKVPDWDEWYDEDLDVLCLSTNGLVHHFSIRFCTVL